MKPYETIRCARCDGHGQVSKWSEPEECPDCGGSGQNVRYESGTIARYPGGPLLGKERSKTTTNNGETK
jgi:RecJ-like exonuclease